MPWSMPQGPSSSKLTPMVNGIPAPTSPNCSFLQNKTMTSTIRNSLLSSGPWSHGDTIFMVLPSQYKYSPTTKTWCTSIKPRHWTDARPDSFLTWLTLTWKSSTFVGSFLLALIHCPVVLTYTWTTQTILKLSSSLTLFLSILSILSSTLAFPLHPPLTPSYYNAFNHPWNHLFLSPSISTYLTGRSLKVSSPTRDVCTFRQMTHSNSP